MIPKLLCAVYSVHCSVVSLYHINGTVSRKVKDKVIIPKLLVCPYHINGTVSRKVKDKVEDTKVVMCSIQYTVYTVHYYPLITLTETYLEI